MQNSSEMFRQQIIRAMHVMAADPQATDHAMAGALRSVGHDELEAEVLVAFLPLGLARAVISRLPDAVSCKLSKHAIILDNGRQMKVPLMQVPEFVEALRLGEETFTTGVIPREVFSEVATCSVELKLINQALNDGQTVEHISPPFLIRLVDAPGFADWYSAVASPRWLTALNRRKCALASSLSTFSKSLFR